MNRRHKVGLKNNNKLDIPRRKLSDEAVLLSYSRAGCLHSGIKLKYPFQRIDKKGSLDTRNFVAVLAEIFSSLQEITQNKETPVSPNKVLLFALTELRKHAILN